MRLQCFILFLFLFLFGSIHATHNRAGEIVYKRIAPTFTVVDGFEVPVYIYSITVIVYTDHGPSVADRCADTVYFGDGQRGIAYRINGGTSLGCACQGNVPCGELIINQGNYVVKKNIYTIIHEYPGAGKYLISMADPNRNGGVHNIPNSDQHPFYLESELIISNVSGANSSPVFNCDPIYKACLGKCFYHNPCAFDPDGDSLSYKITTSRGYGGTTVPGYFFPETGGGSFGIDEITGTVIWCTPQVVAEYNIAFIVEEWRKNSSGTYIRIGTVLRDMQVVVEACPNNDPPTVLLPPDTCVEAGATVIKNFRVSDPNAAQSVSISGNGGAFSLAAPNKAFLSPTFGASSGYTSVFTWQTSCDQLRQQPYQNYLLVVDYSNVATNPPFVNLSYYAQYNIRVVPPTIKNVSATPQGSSMKITWTGSSCSPASNPLLSYQIYRMDSCVTVSFDPCESGIPANSGFNLIGSTSPSITEFIDDNAGNGLVVGKSYSYLVIANYKDGTKTLASAQVCAKLTRNIPIITKVDVLATDLTNGSVAVAWERPVTDVNNLDTLIFKGPYQFNLRYRAGSSAPISTVFTSSSPYFLGLATNFTHNGLNTIDTRVDYQVEFISGTVTVGNSPLASSVYLKTSPSDRQVALSWEYETPWNNYNYEIWRKAPGSALFEKIATTVSKNYLDKDSVVNGFTYCYKVTSYGDYSDPGILKPLINNSQESCAKAIDNVAPCSPTLSLSADCPEGIVSLSWNDVTNLACGDDVIKYRLYYKQTAESNYQVIDSSITNQSFTLDGLELVSGCYAVKSVDSNYNESPMSPDFCIDNCPEFELPNVVTDNKDDVNDFFMAIIVRQIKEIDLKIYDRWGNLVYETKDPYFKWNTVNLYNGAPVSEGTFFYICDVFEPRLKGIVKRNIKGYMQVIR
jgi:gliding motility-associated-like protein